MPKKSSNYEFKYLMFQHPYRVAELMSDLEREFGGKFTHFQLNKPELKVGEFKFAITKVNNKIRGYHKGTGNIYTYFIELK